MKRRNRLPEAVRRLVRKRSGGRCEYCRFPLALDPALPAADHIIARQHGGTNDLGNLADACFFCNTHKGSNVAGIDPDTVRITRLFHPRQDHWSVHFSWRGGTIVGLTAVGRTTVRLLQMNMVHRVAAREILMKEGVF